MWNAGCGLVCQRLPESERLCAAPDWPRVRRFCRRFHMQKAWCHCAICGHAPPNRVELKTPSGDHRRCWRTNVWLLLLLFFHLKDFRLHFRGCWASPYVCVDSHPHLTALDTLVSAVEQQTGAQQVGLGLHVARVCVEASLWEQQRSVPPVVAVRLLARSPVCVQARVGAPIPVEGHRRRASVQCHPREEALLYQLGPHCRPWVAAPVIRPEGNGERLAFIHQRRQGFLRIDWRGDQMKVSWNHWHGGSAVFAGANAHSVLPENSQLAI